MKDLLQDIRFSLRAAARRPGFAGVVVVTLALGIGVNSSIFSLVYGVLLRPLSYGDPGRLVRLFENLPQNGLERAPVSALNFLDWGRQNQVFSGLACFKPALLTALARGGREEPEPLDAGLVSASLLDVLRVKPTLGRGFLPGEDQPSAAPVALLSHDFWQRRFDGSADAVGRILSLDGRPTRIVGVMPADFEFMEGAQVWVPLVLEGQDLLHRGRANLQVIGRLRTGVGLERARAHMSTIADRLAREYGEGGPLSGVTVIPLYEQVVGEIRPTLLVLMAAVGFVLLVASANVANLFLARTAERQGEIALRAALGADRRRLTRQMLTESLLFAVAGGALGLWVASLLTEWLLRWRPNEIPRLATVGITPQVVIFTCGVALVAGVAFGLVTALLGTPSRLAEALKEGALQSQSSFAKRRLRRLLVAAEMALALVLLIGAGLMVRSFSRLLAVDPGFEPRGTLYTTLALPPEKYPDEARLTAFGEELVRRLESLPGVEAAAVVTSLPMKRIDSRRAYAVEGRAPTAGGMPLAVVDAASPELFRAMGIPLVKGRTFDRRDTNSAARVVVVDETLERQWWPDGGALGKRLILPGVSMTYREVIGVVGSVRRYGLDADLQPQMYVPFGEAPKRMLSFVLRTRQEPLGLAAGVRQKVLELDPTLPGIEVDTLSAVIDQSIAQPRFNTRLIGLLGGLALMLSVVGIYSVMAYSVVQRTREIGVRMALGSRPERVLRLVLGDGMKLALIGLGFGLPAALGLTRLMSSLLFGVSPSDPLTFAVLSFLLLGAAFAASYFPARKAARVDPMVALRAE
jgi:putative ABC transport system permease protein